MLSDFPILAAIPATDLERAKAFYRDTLGFEPVDEIPETREVFYSSGGTSFFVYATPFAGTNQATTAAWRVDDLDETMSVLRGRGVVFEEFETEDYKTVDGVVVAPDGPLGSGTARGTSWRWTSHPTGDTPYCIRSHDH